MWLGYNSCGSNQEKRTKPRQTTEAVVGYYPLFETAHDAALIGKCRATEQKAQASLKAKAAIKVKMLTAFENANPPIQEVQANKQTLLPMPATDTNSSGGMVHRRCQLVLEEGIINGIGIIESSLEHALLQSEARNDDHMMQVVEYTNQADVETEQRVGDRLQAALRAAHDHIVSSTAAQAAQQTLELQTQIDRALDTVQQNVIQSADSAMADRAKTMEKAIAAGLEQTEMAAFEYTNQTSLAVEQRMQQALDAAQDRIERSAIARELKNNVRLEAKLKLVSDTENHKTRGDLKRFVNKQMGHIRGEVDERLPNLLNLQNRSVDNLLQEKLNKAVKSSESELRNFVDNGLLRVQKDVYTQVNQSEDKLLTSLSSRISGTETRMQRMLLDARQEVLNDCTELNNKINDNYNTLKRQTRTLEDRVHELEMEIKQYHTSLPEADIYRQDYPSTTVTRDKTRNRNNSVAGKKAIKGGPLVTAASRKNMDQALFSENRDDKAVSVNASVKTGVLDAARAAASRATIQRASRRAASLCKRPRERE
ncbi:unnamed protein product [Phytophthora fragariaefolia]|uniref:Unnamed protein product n=1 Tax=Phytophthora fragariaefolia TaxID=1490495 RepID=A0A9W6XBV7_9STRA|nr:unnamed protein product [Phytophthora fragariaefolia]